MRTYSTIYSFTVEYRRCEKLEVVDKIYIAYNMAFEFEW